jgi:hypothetical protein
MDGEAFEDLIDRLRGDMSNWPDAKRHAGKILLTSSRKAQPLIEKAQPLIEQAWTLRATLRLPRHPIPVVALAATRGAIPPHFQHFLFSHDPATGTKAPY